MSQKPSVAQQYQKAKQDYDRLGYNVQEAFKSYLDKQNIVIQKVSYQVKAFDDLMDRFDGRTQPAFDQMSDICRIHIICFSAFEVARIRKIIQQELKVIEERPEVGLCFEVKLKKAWSSASHFKGLEQLVFEIEVTTILDNARHDIENYFKQINDVQETDKTAEVLMETGKLFDGAKEKLNALREIMAGEREIAAAASDPKGFDTNRELDSDSLQALLNYHIQHRRKSRLYTNTLLSEMEQHVISLADLDRSLVATKHLLRDVEKEYFETLDLRARRATQVGWARWALVLKHDTYWKEKKAQYQKALGIDEHHAYIDIVEKWRKKLSK